MAGRHVNWYVCRDVRSLLCNLHIKTFTLAILDKVLKAPSKCPEVRDQQQEKGLMQTINI